MDAKGKISIVFAVATLALVAGAIFTVMHWPFATELLIGGYVLEILALIIYQMSKRKLGKQEVAKENMRMMTWKKYLNLALGFAALLVITGATFKVMHWPYASELLISGQMLGGLGLIAWFVNDKRCKTLKNSEYL